MEILAHAKINLTLDITGKREEDSYHLLDMVMQSITLSDTVGLHEGTDGQIRIECRDDRIPRGPENTAYRAAEEFFREAGIKCPGLRIHLRKWIPSQAGLGGGSTDAAAVLFGLNKMYEARLSMDRLLRIGLRIGADVPFCLLGGTARVQGIGEKITPLRDMPDCPIVICKPPVSVSTREAYRKYDLAPGGHPAHTERMVAAIEQKSLSSICGALGNQFEEVLDLPEVNALKEKMQEMGAIGTSMTGSGSVVYGIFKELEKAASCEKALKAEYPETFLCEVCREPMRIIP